MTVVDAADIPCQATTGRPEPSSLLARASSSPAAIHSHRLHRRDAERAGNRHSDSLVSASIIVFSDPLRRCSPLLYTQCLGTFSKHIRHSYNSIDVIATKFLVTRSDNLMPRASDFNHTDIRVVHILNELDGVLHRIFLDRRRNQSQCCIHGLIVARGQPLIKHGK